MKSFIFGRATFLKKCTGIATIAVFLFQFAAPLATTANAVEPTIAGAYTLVLDCTGPTEDIGDYCKNLHHSMTITSHDATTGAVEGTGKSASNQDWTITGGTITATDVSFSIKYDDTIDAEQAYYTVKFYGTRNEDGSMQGTAEARKFKEADENGEGGMDYRMSFNWHTEGNPDQPVDHPSPVLTQCSVVSDTKDLVEESGTLAVEVATTHPNWASVLGDAKWIWSNKTVQHPTTDETQTFKKGFTVDEVTTAMLHIAADNGYKVIVNGKTVVDNLALETAYLASNSAYTTGIDISSYIHNGYNTLQILVKNFAMDGGTTETNPAGLMYKLDLAAENCANVPSGGPVNGSITIYSYVCPGSTIVNRTDNGYGKTIPAGCVPEPDARYGYTQDIDGYRPDIYNPETDSYEPDPEGLGGSPDPDLDGPYVGSATGDVQTPFVLTNSDGVSYNDSLSRHYRYTIVKVGADNKKLPNSAVLGLFCQVDTDPAIDNMDVTYIEAQLNSEGDLVFNSNCVVYNRQERPVESLTPGPQVHVYKYVRSVRDQSETLVTESPAIAFPMYSTWEEPGKDVKEGYYKLGNHNGGAPDQFGSITAKMLPHSWYTTYEQTNDKPGHEAGGVFPIGAACQAGPAYYRLVGYRVGDSLENAETATLVTNAATINDLTNDAYVIVVNEKCSDVLGQTDTQQETATQPVVQPEPKTSERGVSGSIGTGGQQGVVLGASATSADNEKLPASCSEYLHSYIKYGGNNDNTDVIRLQAFLNKYLGIKLTVNGVYDKETFEALKAFQVKEADQVLAPWKETKGGINENGTGYVYKTTKRWINLLNCPTLNIPLPTLM